MRVIAWLLIATFLSIYWEMPTLMLLTFVGIPSQIKADRMREQQRVSVR